MGMVPVAVISPLTVPRSDEPRLEPTIATVRVQQRAGNAGDQDDGYSPSHQQPPPELVPGKPDATSPLEEPDPDHEVNVFA